MKHRNDNMLLRIAQGDAYALALEYVNDTDAPGLREELYKLEKFHKHPTYHKLNAGQYTDDTQMSAAVAQVLIDSVYNVDRGGTKHLSSEHFIDRFFDFFKRDPRDGCSRNFQAILEEAKDATHLRQLIIPNSIANGAAMRSVPLGVIKNPKEIVEIAGLQASTTHATYGGINSSVTVALMSHFALYDHRSFSSMLKWGNQYCPAFELFREPWVGPVKARKEPGDLGVGLNTAWAVHTLLTQETSLKGIMRKVIEWGGDTDSVASIAWGIASCRYQNEELPSFLESDLEVGGKYGPEFLKNLGKNLMSAYMYI
jgi:ADP-ribosylglycohydrolase